jgi:GPH family glycoside/pentoside/hexuronide:cation symporter
MVFWLVLSFTDIPYLALGSEMNDDYEDRNTLRAIANVLGYVAMILASSGTLMLVGWFSGAGATTSASWRYMGIIYGAIIIAAFMTAYLSTKGKEQPYTPDAAAKDAPKQNLFKSYLEVLKTGPFARIIIYTIFAYGSILIFSSCIMYYTLNNVGLTETQVALYMLVYSFMVIGISFALGAIGTRIEKRTIVVVSILLVAVVSVIFHFTGMTPATLWVYFAIYAFAISAYFVQIYSMVYDVCTLDEFTSKEERSGTIISMFYFMGKFVGGISLFVIGWVLSGFGYDATAAVQTDHALTGISSITLLIPGVCYAIGGIAMLSYPINHKNFDAIVDALDKRKKGEAYSTDGFKELLK